MLGARSKQAGEILAATEARLTASHPRNRLAMARSQLDATARHLEALGYRSILQRGFSVTRTADARIMRSAGETKPGERIETEVADGRFTSVVDSSPKPAAEENAGAAEHPAPATQTPKENKPSSRKPREPDEDSPLLFD